MKYIIVFIILFSLSITHTWAQDAETSFHHAAGQYVKGSINDARNTVASALQKYPHDPKLNSLMEKLKKENPENKEDQKQQEEENQEEKEKDQNQEENQQEKEGEEDSEKKNENEGKEEEGEENEQGEPGENEEQRSRSEKLEEINISEEKARMILEAMKNNEIQYIQQNRRKIRENADYGKPDW